MRLEAKHLLYQSNICPLTNRENIAEASINPMARRPTLERIVEPLFHQERNQILIDPITLENLQEVAV